MHRVSKGGKIYRWHRPTRTKLPDDVPETHPDFIAAWAAAEAMGGKRPSKTPAGTIAAEVEAMLATAHFKAFSPTYRHEVRRESDAIRDSYGTAPITGLRAHHISADLAKLAPRQANARLKTWRLICKSAKARGTIKADPSTGIRKVRIETDGYASWSASDIETFRKHWAVGTVQRACFELVFWTGSRTVDAVQLGRQHVGSDGLLVFRQSKTGGRAHVPWTSPLPAFAATWATERDQMRSAIACLSGGMTFLQTERGASRSIKGLGNVINDAARDAGLTDRTAHGLRKARLTMIAEHGGSAHAIMAWGGHKTLAEAQRYTMATELKRLVMGTEQDQNEVNRADIPVNRR